MKKTRSAIVSPAEQLLATAAYSVGDATYGYLLGC